MTRSKDTYALFVHGIGTQNSHFADFAQKTLSAALSEHGGALYGRSVHYAPLFAMAADKFLREVERAGTDVHATHKLTVNTLADAIQYAMNPTIRTKIQGVLDYEFLSLRAPDEVTIFAHSLGCLAVVDWLRTRTGIKKVRFVTMGCNIGLFSLGMPWVSPPQVGAKGRWTNLWDEDDMLGFPVALEDHPEFAHVEDIEVSVGRVLGGTGLAHIMYLEDKHLWSRTIPDLLLR
jgi:hypothetical protein